MAKESLTLVLNGEVVLADFAVAVAQLQKLIEALTNEVAAGGGVDWVVDSLDAGSAAATFRGDYHSTEELAHVEAVVRAYERVGKGLESGSVERLSESVSRPAVRIARLAKDRITSVRFETDEIDAEVYGPIASLRQPPTGVFQLSDEPQIAVRGAVEGRVQSLSNRRGLRFTLYDAVSDRAVSCYLASGSEEMMRDAWGKPAIVQGMVRRDPKTGRATTVRSITSVEIVTEGKPGDWREAIGAAPIKPGEAMPEDAIRKLRDAE